MKSINHTYTKLHIFSFHLNFKMIEERKRSNFCLCCDFMHRLYNLWTSNCSYFLLWYADHDRCIAFNRYGMFLNHLVRHLSVTTVADYDEPHHPHMNRCAGSQDSSSNTHLEKTEKNGRHHHYPFQPLPHLLWSHFLFPSFTRWTHGLSQKEECVCFSSPSWCWMAC